MDSSGKVGSFSSLVLDRLGNPRISDYDETNKDLKYAAGTGHAQTPTTPTFVSISPTVGPVTGGTVVTITGTNLVGTIAVTFNGTAATGVSVISATSLAATTPAGIVGSVNVAVTTPNGTATGTSAYTYLAAPTFTSIIPSSGSSLGGTAVTIAGANFGSGGLLNVTIGGAPATSVVWVDSSHITAVTPAGTAGTQDIVITNNDGETVTATGAYTYFASPAFVSISPAVGPVAGGTIVTITGTNLIGTTAVTFNGTAATGVSVISATSLTATTPAGTVGSVNVVITTPNGTATGTGAYTYSAAPTFTSISPSIGLATGGTVVTITGTNLIGATAVTFGSTAATGVSVVNVTTIIATTPPNTAGVVNVVITTSNGTATGTGAYTYGANPPSVTSIIPNTGVSGATVSVTNLAGTNFVPGTTPVVLLEKAGESDIIATNVNVVSSTKITCKFTLPAPTDTSIGNWNVVVVNADTQSGSLSNGFTILKPAPAPAPSVTSISPNTGTAGNSVAVTLAGTNFVVGSSTSTAVWLAKSGSGNITATNVNVVSSTQITCTLPLSAPSSTSAGQWDVVVRNPDYQTGTLGNAFTVVNPPIPTVTGILPVTGPIAGGTTVTITGTNLTGATAVAFGTAAASSYTVTSATSITATSPAGFICRNC